MSGKLCPLLNKDCVEHACKFFVHLLGNNPQSGKAEDKFDCTFAFLPILMIENSQMQRQTGAAVESLRNENVALGGVLGSLAMVAQQNKQLKDK